MPLDVVTLGETMVLLLAEQSGPMREATTFRRHIIVPGNVAKTADNIVASQSLFRAGFATDLVVFVIEVALAAVLYALFRPVSRTLALVMSFARLAMVSILGLNLLNMFTALQLLTSPQYTGALDKGQLQALAFMFLNAQHYGYALGMVFFGLHLGVLGYLVYRSGFLPRILGILMVLSALGIWPSMALCPAGSW